MALRDAIRKLPPQMPEAPGYDPAHALIDRLAAVSVGVVDDQVLLDLDYRDDSRASVDLNVAYTAAGRFVEVQGSAEHGAGFPRTRLDELLNLAEAGCRKLLDIMG